MKINLKLTLIIVAVFAAITWFSRDNEQTNADLSEIGWPFTFHRYFSGKIADPVSGVLDTSTNPSRSTFFLMNLMWDLLILIALMILINFLFQRYRSMRR